MANYNEIADHDVLSLPVKNYGGTDIGDNLGVLFDTTSGNLMGIVLPTASGGVAKSWGATVGPILAGKQGRVRVLGTRKMTANGSIAVGALVQLSDTTAKLGWVKTLASGGEQFGRALTPAADGEPILVQISAGLAAP